MKGGKPPAFGPQDIIEFIFFPVVNEGCRVVAEGIVDKPADLDVATVLAMGFPPYRRAPAGGVSGLEPYTSRPS
jgi:enoyl-CoA hydratase/3-hydroxyacyl-CoA dehydrogenase